MTEPTVHPFEARTLRYYHDALTCESLNVGVLLLCREAEFLQLEVISDFRRLEGAFIGFDARSLKRMLDTLNGSKVIHKYCFDAISTDIYPHDDSALQWGNPGGGLRRTQAQPLRSSSSGW